MEPQQGSDLPCDVYLPRGNCPQLNSGLSLLGFLWYILIMYLEMSIMGAPNPFNDAPEYTVALQSFSAKLVNLPPLISVS